MTYIQFVARNVIGGSSAMNERWLVGVNCAEAKREMMRGLYWSGEDITVRRYDEVMAEEYKTFLRLNDITKELLSLK